MWYSLEGMINETSSVSLLGNSVTLTEKVGKVACTTAMAGIVGATSTLIGYSMGYITGKVFS